METNHVPLSEYLTLSQAANLLPNRPHSAAVWRWCRRGTVARNGVRIRLRHGRAGGRVFTTEAWLQEFFEAVAAADCEAFDARQEQPGRTAPRRGRVRTPAQRESDVRRAKEELRNRGL